MNKNKTITIVIALIIILGIIIALTSGFNVKMITKRHKQVEFDLGKEFNIEDIKQITGEVFGGNTVEIQKVETYGEQVLISSEEITEEQKNDLVTKINEKLQTEIKAEEAKIESIPRVKLSDYITPHIWEFIFATILVAMYVVIRFKKLGVLKTLVQTILGIIIAELLAFSIIAITRIPVGSEMIAILFGVYTIAILVLTTIFEKNLRILKLEEQKNKKE